MAELTISADDIEGAIASYVSSFEAGTGREEIGTVIDAGDGIAHVEGLPSVMTQELLEFPGGILGVALNLDEHSIGTVVLGEFDKIEQGQQILQDFVVRQAQAYGFARRVAQAARHLFAGLEDEGVGAGGGAFEQAELPVVDPGVAGQFAQVAA